MNCQVCSDEIKNGDAELCPRHARSLESLKTARKNWEFAYGSIPLDEFLRRIAGLPGTGEAAKEVARYLRENPSGWK